MTKRFRGEDPTGNSGSRRADKSRGISRDLALRLAAHAKARGDLAGADRFMAAARRGDNQ